MGSSGYSSSTVNSRGDTLSEESAKKLGPYVDFSAFGGGSVKLDKTFEKDPKKRAELFLNWLTVGGPPKPTEAGAAFGGRVR